MMYLKRRRLLSTALVYRMLIKLQSISFVTGKIKSFLTGESILMFSGASCDIVEIWGGQCKFESY